MEFRQKVKESEADISVKTKAFKIILKISSPKKQNGPLKC